MMESMIRSPRVIAWEITRRCPLACKHCRAGAADHPYQDEFSTEECLRVLDSFQTPQKPMIIWTGGEPMYREDILQLVTAAGERGFRSVMAPCGMFVTPEKLQALKKAGVMALSLSMDGHTEEAHDAFRCVSGAWQKIMLAMENARKAEMPFQINCTVSKLNVHHLPAIREIAIAQGAKALDLFFLVPVGRGKAMQDLALSPSEMESALRWAFEMDQKGPLHVRETCAPQAYRIWKSLGEPGARPSGCMGGKGFVFISHTGELQPCGFLDVPCGNLRDASYNFPALYQSSPVFCDLRNPRLYQGACGNCAFYEGCGGCRARAYAATGDYLAPETSCPIAKAFNP